MQYTFTAADVDEMHTVGRRVAELVQAGDVLVLTGPLGAGKTTFTQGFAAGLGVTGPVTSPTFVLSRIHEHPDSGLHLVHVDAYRLEKADDLLDLELEDWLPDSVVVVEWGEGLVEQLSDNILNVTIDRSTQQHHTDEHGPRVVDVTTHGPRFTTVNAR